MKLVDQIGDEKAAMSWLTKERKVPAGLKIVDWKPTEESTGLFGWLFQSLAASIGTFGRENCWHRRPNLGYPQA